MTVAELVNKWNPICVHEMRMNAVFSYSKFNILIYENRNEKRNHIFPCYLNNMKQHWIS
jgi:hypothetical protein